MLSLAASSTVLAAADTDTDDGRPLVEVACLLCPFTFTVQAFAPIASVDDVGAMANRIAAQHRAAAHAGVTR